MHQTLVSLNSPCGNAEGISLQKVRESKNTVSESSSLHCVVQLNSIGKIFTNYNLSQFLKSQEMLVIYFLSAILNEGLSVFINRVSK